MAAVLGVNIEVFFLPTDESSVGKKNQAAFLFSLTT